MLFSKFLDSMFYVLHSNLYIDFFFVKILVYTVYTELIDLRDWLIGVLDRVRALDELMETCERLPFEFLREQCRVATDALQTANLGLILLELQLKVKINSFKLFSF